MPNAKVLRQHRSSGLGSRRPAWLCGSPHCPPDVLRRCAFCDAFASRGNTRYVPSDPSKCSCRILHNAWADRPVFRITIWHKYVNMADLTFPLMTDRPPSVVPETPADE